MRNERIGGCSYLESYIRSPKRVSPDCLTVASTGREGGGNKEIDFCKEQRSGL